jgi:hypothetical protein
MLETYPGILRDNRIEWSGESPPQVSADRGVRVHVTILDRVEALPSGVERGQRMAAALEQLAAMQSLTGITDPLAWERELREDRVLPDR